MAEKSSGDGGFDLKWELLLADAWEDAALMKRLQTDPTTVLKERGIRVAPGTQVKVLADTDTVAHLVIPQKPEVGELSEEELSTVSAGCGPVFGCFGCGGCGGCGGCSRGCGGGGGCGGCGRGCSGRGCGRGC